MGEEREHIDGEEREQLREERVGRGIALERCGNLALIFDVHMNKLAVA